MNYISRFISEFEINQSMKPMPLVHVTDAYHFRNIIENNMRLETMLDSIFSEELLYFFYGKPLYHPMIEKFFSLAATLPIFMLISPDSIGSARRIFPFDSGAFETGRYANYFPPSMSLDDFLIDCDDGHSGGVAFPYTALQTVTAFYENNANYFSNTPRKDLPRDSFHLEVEAYINMIKSKEISDFDDRASTIEIQITKSLNLTSENLLAIILPLSFVESKDVMAVLMDLEVQPITYPVYRMQPSYLTSLAIKEVGDFLTERHIL